jgi:Ca2+/Na+ antiporter
LKGGKFEMALGVVEIFALIVAVIAIIKILVLISKPKSWLDMVKPFYNNSVLTMIVALILAAVVLYYLVNNGVGIVQIFAVMLFVALLACMTMSLYMKDMLKMAEKLVKDKQFLKKAWLPILIWLALSIWALVKIF